MRNPHGKRRPIGAKKSGGATSGKPRSNSGPTGVASNRQAIVIRGKTDDDPGRRALVPWHRSRYSPKPGERVGRAKPGRNHGQAS